MSTIPPSQFPTMSDLWEFTKNMYDTYTEEKYMFSKDKLRDIRLALESICCGSQAQYFDGHTNIKGDGRILGFGMNLFVTQCSSILFLTCLTNC